MGALSILAVLALAASAVAGPITSSGPCARQCTESAKFRYTPGTSYFFDYESDVLTTMQGATREESRLHLKAKTEIHAISKCDFVMRLSEVSLEYSDPLNPKSRTPVNGINQFRQSLERYTLRFSFQDGVVETICPADDETVQVLNIKRGILSALQTSAETLESPEEVLETDVSGECRVKYEPLGRGWNSVSVRKVKDLSTCSGRHSADTAIQINPFMEGKETKSMSLVKGTQDCKQIFKQDRLESVTCGETHLFRPFSRQEGGAMTKVSQVLTYVSEQKTAFTGAEFSSYRKAMSYDHEPDAKEVDRRTREVEGLLRDLCTATKDDITPAVPQKFTTLVYGLRQLEYTDLNNMYQRVDQICPGNNKAKKIFLDGAAMAGTSGALKFIVEVINRGEMPEKEVDLWISTLAFVNKPSKESLVALLPLLDGKRLNAILPISAVVHTYCRQHTQCGHTSEVRQITQKIVELVGDKCDSDKEQVILALKAMGNIGVAIETEEKLQACVENTKLDTEVRIAAIQAYRRFGCGVRRSPIMDRYTQQDENAEVRIAAFLNVISCPSEETLSKVRATMEAEQLKQVGSFVMSYLKNVEKRPRFQGKVHDIVSNVEYLNKFESDIRKFSRNYQTSFHLDALNSGFDVESNIVFGTDSYLPRTAMMNFTLEMWGVNVNVFQMDARAEGLEKIVEKMFGPEGYFRKDTSKSPSNPRKHIADNKIEKLDEKFDVKSSFEKEPSLSLDMKMFGNSLWYKKIRQGNVAAEAFDAMDILVELAKEQDVELTKSFLFLDTTLHIPTGSGMPMKLAINGSAVMNLKMKGKVDARSLQSIDVHGAIEPSCAVTIATTMSVDAGVAQAALRMEVTAHSSTSLDGLLEVRDGKVWHASLNMPREQQQIIDVQSRIFLGSAQEEREQNSMVEKNSVHSACTGKFTDKALGVELCSEMQLPVAAKKGSPLYPFSGPAQVRLFLRKTDPTLTKYNVEMKWTEDKSGRAVVGQHLVMSFNTPESKIDREVSAEVHLSKEDSTFSMKFKAPNKKFALTGKRVLKEDEKRLSVAVSVDDQEKFSVSASLLNEAIEGGIRYQPALEIRGPSSRLLNIRSSASLKSSKYSGEIVIEDLTTKPLVVNGELTVAERNRYEITAMTESHALSAKLKGYVQVRNGLASKLSGQYRFMEGQKETVETTFKIRDLSASGLTKYSGAASLVSSARPELASSVAWETQLTSGHIENSFDISIGDGQVRKTHKISMSEILKYQGDLKNNNVEGTMRLTYPEKDIDFAVQVNHKNTLDSLLNTVSVKLAPGREASSSIDLKFDPNPMKLSSDVQFKYPGRELILQGNVIQKQNSDYEASATAQWQRGKQIRATGIFKDGSTRNGRDYRATLEMTIPNTRPISFASQLTAMPGQYMISADGGLGRDQYSLKTEYAANSAWNHKASAVVKLPKMSYTAVGTLQKNGETVTGNIDVNVPEYRRVTGNVEVTNGGKVKSGAANIMWDADRDQSRRVQADAEIRLNADGNEGKFNLRIPIKTMSGSYKCNYAGQLSSGIVRGNLQTELQWGDNQKFTAELSGNTALKKSRHQVNGEIKIATPLNGYENLLLSVQHSDAWPEWNNKLIAQWKPNQKIIFGTEGKLRSDSSSSMVDASIRLNTPFPGLESISARQSFEKRPSEVISFSSVQWTPKKGIELSLSGALEGSNMVRAGANLTSPFIALQDLSVSLSNSLSKESLNTDVNLRWNTRNKVTVGVNGVNRNSNIEGKIVYSSTFRNFESGELILKHESDGQKVSSNIESRLPYGNNLNIKLLGNMPSYREMDSSLDISSSFVDGIAYQVAYKVDRNRLAANGEATYGAKKFTGEIQGTNRAGSKSWEYDYKLNVNTPIRGFEDIKMSATQKRRDVQYITRLQVSKNQETLTLNHDVKIDDPLNFVNVLRVTTPFRMLRSAEINTSQTGKAGEYKHSTEIQWGSKKGSVAMELNNREQRRGHNLDARLSVKSPFSMLSSLDVEARHEDDEKSYEPKLNIRWNDNNVISLDGMLKNDRLKKVETSLKATTSFRGLDLIMFTARYDVNAKQKTAELSYRWSENSKNTVNIKGTLEADGNTGVIEMIATSPVRGYENVQLKSDYTLSERENSLNVLSQYGASKYSLSSKHVQKDKGSEVSAEMVTPIRGYEKLAAFGSYTFSKNDMSTELSYEWSSNRKVDIHAEIQYRNGKTTGRATVNTPFAGYKEMGLQVESNTASPRKTAFVSVEWEASKSIVVDGAFESDFLRFANIEMQLKSPFENFQHLSLNGKVNDIPKEFSAELNAQWMPNKKVTGQILLKEKVIFIMVDTPFRPYKNIKFTSNIQKIENEGSVTAGLEWDNANKADMSANYKISDKMLEGKAEVNIPLKGKQTYSVSGSFMNDNLKMMEGRVKINTPKELYEASTLIRQNSENKEITLSIQGPKSQATLNYNVVAKTYRDIEGNLKMDSTIKFIPSFSVKGSYKNNNWKDLSAKLVLDDLHSVHGSFKDDDMTYQVDATIASPFIPSKRATISAKINAKDIQNMDGNFVIELASQRHSLSVTEKYSKRGFEAELKANSPVIRGQELSVNTFYSYKKSKDVQGKLSVVENRKPHTVEFNFNSENRDMVAKLNIQSDMLPSEKLNMAGKLSRPTENSFETTLTAETSSAQHTLVATGKFPKGELDMTITLDSPAVSPRPISFTVSMSNDNFKNIDVSVSLRTASGESRGVFNVKRNGWRDLESSFALDSPIDLLKMLRVGLKMKNEGLKNVEMTLDIKSSLEAMRFVSMSGQMRNTEGASDVSFNFKSPIKNWESVSISANMEKNEDWSQLKPTITLSMPNKKYAAFITYEHKGSTFQTKIGGEWDVKKADISFEKHDNEIRFAMSTPIRGYEHYTAVINFKNDKARRTAQIMLEDAMNRKYSADISLNFQNYVNFLGETKVSLPVDGLRDISAKLRQTLRRGSWTMSFDHSMGSNKKITMKIDHSFNPLSGTILFVSPIEKVKNLKVDYNLQSSNNAGKMDIVLNDKPVFRLQLEKPDSSDYSRNVEVALPTLSYILSFSSKPLPGGYEITMKSVVPQRAMNFQTMYQSSSTHFSHGSKLSLDERAGQTISYEVRSSPTSRQGNEIYARLNMPVRSLELRTTHEMTSTGRTVSGDLFWDIAKDQTKHMKLTVEHADNSNRNNVAHKIRVIIAHPQLEKDIVLATEFLKSPSEVYGKTEVEYSRQQQHNIFLEGRVKSTAESRREKRYLVSMTARHPVTKIDVQVAGEVSNNQDEMTAEMQLNYLDRNLRKQIQELRTKIQKVKQNMELMARSNENKINLLGRMHQQNNQLTFALEQSVNDETPKQSQVRWNYLQKKMDLNISSPFGGRIYVKAAMPDDHVEIAMGHATAGRQYEDGNFYLGLKNSKILESKIHWRPEAYSEAQESLSRSYTSYKTWQTSVITSVQTEISSEVSSKSEKLVGSVLQENKQFIDEMSREIKKMRIDSQRAAGQMSQMYKNDAFFMKSSAGYAMSGIETISQGYETTVEYIIKTSEIVTETVSSIAGKTMNIVESAVEDLSYASKNYAKYAQKSLASMSESASQLTSKYVKGLGEFGSKTFESVAKVTSGYMTRTSSAISSFTKLASNSIKNAASWTQKLVTEHPGYKALDGYISRISVTVSDFKGQMVVGTRIIMRNSMESIDKAYTYVRDHPNVNYITDAASGAFDQSRRIASDLGLDTMMVNVLEELFQKTHQLSWNTVRDMVEQYADIQRNAKINYDPRNGKIDMEIQLPVMKDSLKELLDINSYPQIQQLKDLGGQLSLEDLYFWDSYYKYKRYMDLNYWVPPFKAQAMLVGSQHYLTFDDFDFDFAGECSYLLARDFVDGNFTVTVNYARENRQVIKKSLNIYTDGVKIEVSRDSKVTVDDHKVELPQIIGETALTLEDGVITVYKPSDFKLKCHIKFDFCMLQLSGFYFGKTGGLFGTNNYEPADDMITPTMRIQNLDEFATSWQVGNPQCTQKRNFAEVPSVNVHAREKCERYFNSYKSQLRAGFKQVSPDPFLRMCIKDLSPLRESEQMSKICSSVAAYIERCREEGVYLNMPKHCVQCERMNANNMEFGDVMKITKDEPVRAADVVFIVEEKDCNNNAPAVLSKLAQSVEDGFRKRGYRQVNFAVVGFGGDGVYSQPHIVTSDSQIFGSVRNIDSALNSLPTGNGPSDIFMALRYAAGLPFLTGSTKTFVLSKCSPCKAHKMKADYSEMLRTMLDSDITLHLLMDHEFETKPPNKPEQAKKVLGFDMKHAYTTKDMKNSEIRGDRDLLAQLKKPKDLCVPLALEVNGSFFSMARLQEKRNANKKNVEILTKRIMKTAKPAECQICECIETASGIGKSVCQRCVSPVVARLASDDFSPMRYYDSNENEVDVW